MKNKLVVFQIILLLLLTQQWFYFQNYVEDKYNLIFENGQIKTDLLYYYFRLSQVNTVFLIFIIGLFVKIVFDIKGNRDRLNK